MASVTPVWKCGLREMQPWGDEDSLGILDPGNGTAAVLEQPQAELRVGSFPSLCPSLEMFLLCLSFGGHSCPGERGIAALKERDICVQRHPH